MIFALLLMLSPQAFFRFSAQGVLEASDADLVGVLGMHPQFVDRSADLEARPARCLGTRVPATFQSQQSNNERCMARACCGP